MKNLAKIAAIAAAAMSLAACEGRADENAAAAAENVASDVGNLAEDAAGATANVAEDVGSAVGNGVDAASDSLQANSNGNDTAANVSATSSANSQ
jgi:hypothetical protein